MCQLYTCLRLFRNSAHDYVVLAITQVVCIMHIHCAQISSCCLNIVPNPTERRRVALT